MQPAITSRIKIMAGLDIAERRLPQDGAISITVDDNRIDLRVSTLPNKFGEKVVIRIIDTRNALVTLNQLGLSPETYEAFAEQVKNPHGILLVTGPTGSGKSTTLYAVLNEINHPSINICTVEDPVEFHIAGVNQFQVHEKIGLSFANVLRSLLRQDPDVIMLGEIAAATQQEAARLLRADGKYVVKLRRLAERLDKEVNPTINLTGGRVRPDDLILLFGQLSIMVETGVALTDALHSILAQTMPGKFQNVLKQILHQVESGEPFSEALRQHPKAFGSFYVNLIRAAEASGTLGPMLDRCAKYIAYRRGIRKKVKSALTYPAILMCACIGGIAIALLLPIMSISKVIAH